YPVSPRKTPNFCATLPLGWKSERSVALNPSSRLNARRLQRLSTEMPITAAFSRSYSILRAPICFSSCVQMGENAAGKKTITTLRPRKLERRVGLPSSSSSSKSGATSPTWSMRPPMGALLLKLWTRPQVGLGEQAGACCIFRFRPQSYAVANRRRAAGLPHLPESRNLVAVGDTSMPSDAKTLLRVGYGVVPIVAGADKF